MPHASTDPRRPVAHQIFFARQAHTGRYRACCTCQWWGEFETEEAAHLAAAVHDIQQEEEDDC